MATLPPFTPFMPAPAGRAGSVPPAPATRVSTIPFGGPTTGPATVPGGSTGGSLGRVTPRPVSTGAPSLWEALKPPELDARGRAAVMKSILGRQREPDPLSPGEAIVDALRGGLEGYLAARAVGDEQAADRERLSSLAQSAGPWATPDQLSFFNSLAEGGNDPTAYMAEAWKAKNSATASSGDWELKTVPTPEGDVAMWVHPSGVTRPYTNQEGEAPGARGSTLAQNYERYLADEAQRGTPADKLMSFDEFMEKDNRSKAPDELSPKQAYDLYNEAQAIWDTYAQMEIQLDVAMRTESGKFQAFVHPVRQALESIGINTDQWGSDVALGEVLTALQNQGALRLRNPESGFGLPGAASDTDLRILRESVAGLDKTPEGNRAIMMVLMASTRRQAELKSEMANYISRNHGLEGWDDHRQKWVSENPLFTDDEVSFLDHLKANSIEAETWDKYVPFELDGRVIPTGEVDADGNPVHKQLNQAWWDKATPDERKAVSNAFGLKY